MIAVEELIPAEVHICETGHLRPFANLVRQEAESATRRIKRFQAIFHHLLSSKRPRVSGLYDV